MHCRKKAISYTKTESSSKERENNADPSGLLTDCRGISDLTYKEAYKLSPDDPGPASNLSAAFLEIGRYEESIS